MKRYSNEEIINGIISNDSEVLYFIYEQNYGKIESFVLLNHGNKDEAADVFQESMIVIYNKIRQNQLILTAHFDTYLFGVAKLVWKALLRKKARYVASEQFFDNILSEDDIQKNLIQNEKHQLVWHYFQKLSSDCQKVFQLFFDGKTIREITEIMDYRSEQHTKNRRFRCKERLLEIISRDKRFQELMQGKY
jgi:RNA polymerase sigma factor (sigma-70 family)